MRVHWRGLACIVAGTLLGGAFSAAPALAQEEAAPADDEATERARALFGEGIELVEQRRWAEAAERFRAARELRDAPAIRYNLASALFELGQLAEASTLVEGVLADPETPPTIQGHAETLRIQIQDRAGLVTVHLEGATDGVDVTLDGEPFDAAHLGSPAPVDPGTRTFVATRGGAEVAREEVEVTRGQEHEVRLVVAPPPAQVAATPGPEPAAADEGQGGSLLSDWRVWAIGGGALVAVAAVVVVVALATGGGVEDPVEGNFEPGVLRW